MVGWLDTTPPRFRRRFYLGLLLRAAVGVLLLWTLAPGQAWPDVAACAVVLAVMLVGLPWWDALSGYSWGHSTGMKAGAELMRDVARRSRGAAYGALALAADAIGVPAPAPADDEDEVEGS